ncbi:hypothetical protein [Brevibacillus sp. MER 51]|uniref:hypothetical protein n=1 Tax=Brevibacillus sp. MER 51 TaxID=2939560 RepID=UPI00203D01A8|nr:hypothetical protein [Brevibacillus sp. MER 51]MCM3141696.1 hypothetical protein [Brevibacillus sp. MER 51]
MQIDYHGKTYTVVDFARSTVLPEEFIVLKGDDEMLVAPTHDLSGLKHGGVSLNEIKQAIIAPGLKT